MPNTEENKRILAVGAHPDDVEIICSGTLLMLRRLGCELHVASLTLGDCGSFEHTNEEVRRIRESEARRACESLNATYQHLGFYDLCIFNDDRSTRRVTALIREVNPEIIFTHSPQDYMADHEVTSLLVRNASFNAPIPNYSTQDLSRARHTDSVPYLYYAQPMEGVDMFGKQVTPQFYVDISEVEKRKRELLACHESQRNWLRAHHGMDEYLDSVGRWTAALGERASVQGRRVIFAEGFRQHLGHAYPHENIIRALLPEHVIMESAY